MLATAPDALEADFQRFYGLNPDLIWTGELPANRAAARWRGQLQRPGTVRHEATGGEAVAMDDEQLAAYLAAPRTTIRET